LASLEEYVLVNTKKARIECYRRTEDNLWLLQFYTLNDQNFKLTSIEFQGNIIDVYEQVELSKN
jgi:Uma2 family endonuclease